MKMIFMGTPDFAAASLKAIYDEGRHEVCAVFTQPDRPKNRGMKLAFSPVKQLALSHGSEVFQPETLRGGEAADIIRSLAPEIIVVVAYGRIIPREILEIPPKGCINVHGSLLPKYRGAAPIQWSVLNGDREAGVTTMYLDEKMDTGDMIAQRSVKVGEYETSGELFERLMHLGAELLLDTLREIENGTAARIKQNESEAVYVRQLSREDSPIDWTLGSEQVINKIRGLNPWPMAVANFGGKEFKIHVAVRTGRHTEKQPGELVSTGKDGIEVACGDGKTVLITELQAAGGKRMKAADYLLGHRLKGDGS